MADVGDFTPTETTDPDAEPDTFRYFGERFDIPASVGAGSLLRFTYLIKAADGQSKRGQSALRRALTPEGRAHANRELADADVSATSAVYELLKSCLGESQMERFLTCVDANGVTPENLMAVCDQIQGVVGERPTRRSADYSVGPSTNGQPLMVDGFGPTETTADLTPRQMQVAMHEADLISPVALPV